jgi:hypothetical protein
MRSVSALSFLIGVSLLVACGGGAEDSYGDETTTTQATPAEPNRTLPIPGGSSTANPNAGIRAAQPSAPLVWTEPDGWEQVTPASNMRLMQYSVPGSGGDGECVVFYFGPGQGGDAVSNAHRWAGQFGQPDGGNSLDKMQLEALGGAFNLQLVEVTGTYNGGMSTGIAPAEPLPNWMLLGGIIEGPDAPWFFKFTGPEATLREQRDAFIEMLRSVQQQT